MDKERVLALDYGSKRIGVAVSDPLGITAQTRPFIANNDQALDEIHSLIQDNDIKRLLIGLPLHTSGGQSKKSEEVTLFAERIKSNTTISVEFVDERYSTVAATKQLDALGVNRKKQRNKIDSQAAAFLLQGYLDRNL